jgi:hypothetical protein
VGDRDPADLTNIPQSSLFAEDCDDDEEFLAFQRQQIDMQSQLRDESLVNLFDADVEIAAELVLEEFDEGEGDDNADAQDI